MEKVKNIVKWLKKIEEEDYPWSLEGYHDWKLGAASIFAKLATIYQNHETFDKEGIKNHIMKYKHNDEYFVCVPGDKNIIAETRQAMSGLYNLGYDVGNCNVSKFFQEPLFFMNDRNWSNPWDAGAQVSHYLFFHHHTGQKEKNEEMLKKIEKYRHSDGWYSYKPSPNVLINGIMKIFTGFDAIGHKMDEDQLRGMLDYVLATHASYGGCNVYDYVYVLAKCLEIDYRAKEATKQLKNTLVDIFNYQHEDGGFSYHKNSTQIAYYGQKITPGSACGGIHGTGLFSMTLAMIDRALKLDLGLEVPTT